MNKEQKLFFSIVFIFIVFCFWNSIFFINSNVILLLFLTFFTVILAAGRNLISEKLKKLLYYSFFVSICLLFANWISSYSVYINKTFLPDTVEIGLVFWTILSGISLLKNTNFDTKTSNINKKFFLIILIFICSISIALRLWNLGHLGIVNDEGYTTFYSYLINQNRIPCDINTKICYLRGVPYHYLVSLFTLFLGTNEFTVRLPNIVIFIGILFYLYKILNIFKADKKLILLIFGLICFADFGFGLVNLARFYTLGLFFFLTTLYYYYSIFIIKQSKNYFFMIVSIVLGILTFEFNVVFIYFLIDPLLNKNFSLYKNKKFLILGLFIFLSIVLINSRPVYLYLDKHYVSIGNFVDVADELPFKEKLLSRIGFNLFYIDLLIKYLPFILIFSIFGIKLLLQEQKQRKSFIYLMLFCMLAFVFYRSQGFARYARGFYLLLIIFSGYGLFYLNISSKIKYLFIFLILSVNLGNIYYLKTLEYGAKTDKNFILSALPIEKYYPDDKNFINYIKSNYKYGDIIIFDYRIQEVYLKISGLPNPDYVITELEPIEYLLTYPNIRIYQNGEDNFTLYKSGTKFITNRQELLDIIKDNPNKKIFLISSADFSGQKNHSISNKNLYNYINIFCKPVFTGQDGNSKIFDLSNCHL